MRPIPPNHRKLIDKYGFYRKCLFCPEKPQIHHQFQYAGRQISEMWNYIPLCEKHHTGTKGVHNCLETKEIVQLFILKRITKEEEAKYPKINWEQLRKYLNKKYVPSPVKSKRPLSKPLLARS